LLRFKRNQPPASFHPRADPARESAWNRRKEPARAGNPRRRMTGRRSRRSGQTSTPRSL